MTNTDTTEYPQVYWVLTKKSYAPSREIGSMNPTRIEHEQRFDSDPIDLEREACADLLAKMAEKQVWRKAIPEATILHHARQAILNRKNEV